MISKANGCMICCSATRKRTDAFVMFETSSIDTPLIWSQTRGQPTFDDYLECVNNNPVIDFSNVALPPPPEDIDY